MMKLPEMFGCMAFHEKVMQERIPAEAYAALRDTIERGAPLQPETAQAVAAAMRDWAVEKGVTHFTHWFQPLSGVTAEKHDSFLTPDGHGGAIMDFSGKELIRGEPDASSFPSGGLRATFEARGYTAWDPTSCAFIKDNVLCIPTAFCSYGGHALDMRTPLLRSMEVLNTQALRLLRLFGVECEQVRPMIGLEQEYFLIDREAYKRRKDLLYTGRVLLGAKPPKRQELDDHYFGRIKTRIAAFMKDLNEELWRLGIPARTEHNETAPAQHELACVYERANVAVDHNQLVMEIMRKVARRHDLACLLHEKPFAGINGSGKHNNWSMMTDTGINLLEPGDTPAENAMFLTFFCAVLRSVDEYQELLRASVASAGNDLRLGMSEAPPAIISVYVGEELEAVLDYLSDGKPIGPARHENLRIGVDVLPPIPRDNSDRNRTSPFAFTGNKFEFRMLGSSMSGADCTTVLNTIVAESLGMIADALESAEDFNETLHDLLRETVKRHRRIVFNGNGYSEEWRREAAARGLSEKPSAADALPAWADEKNVELFARRGVLSPEEMHARCEIQLENYCSRMAIEARVMLEMARRDIQPAVIAFSDRLAGAVNGKRKADASLACKAETALLSRVSELSDRLYDCTEALDAELAACTGAPVSVDVRAKMYRERVFPAMEALRETADTLESLSEKSRWPYPSCGHMINRV